MSHSPKQAVAFTTCVEASRWEFDDSYEELEEYMDGEGSCLASIAVTLVLVTVALGIAGLITGNLG